MKDLLFDDAGYRMISTHATEAGVRYRYHVSQPSLHGEARTAKLGSVSRVSAPEVEQAIVSTIRGRLAKQKPLGAQQHSNFDNTTLISLISHIEVKKTQLVITLKSDR